jgi:hypothetical protein
METRRRVFWNVFNLDREATVFRPSLLKKGEEPSTNKMKSFCSVVTGYVLTVVDTSHLLTGH